MKEPIPACFINAVSTASKRSLKEPVGLSCSILKDSFPPAPYAVSFTSGVPPSPRLRVSISSDNGKDRRYFSIIADLLFCQNPFAVEPCPTDRTAFFVGQLFHPNGDEITVGSLRDSRIGYLQVVIKLLNAG